MDVRYVCNDPAVPVNDAADADAAAAADDDDYDDDDDNDDDDIDDDEDDCFQTSAIHSLHSRDFMT